MGRSRPSLGQPNLILRFITAKSAWGLGTEHFLTEPHPLGTHMLCVLNARHLPSGTVSSTFVGSGWLYGQVGLHVPFPQSSLRWPLPTYCTILSPTLSATGLTCPTPTPPDGSHGFRAVLSLSLRSPRVETRHSLGPLLTCPGSSLPLILTLRTAPSLKSWATPPFTKPSLQGVWMSLMGEKQGLRLPPHSPCMEGLPGPNLGPDLVLHL